MRKEDGFVSELFCNKYGIYEVADKVERELDKLAKKIEEQKQIAKINNLNVFEKLKDRLRKFKFFSDLNSVLIDDGIKVYDEMRVVSMARQNFLETKKPECGIVLIDKVNNTYSYICKVYNALFNNLKSANEAVDYVKNIKCSVAYMDKLYKLILEEYKSMKIATKNTNSMLTNDDITAFVLDTYSQLKPIEIEDDKIC